LDVIFAGPICRAETWPGPRGLFPITRPTTPDAFGLPAVVDARDRGRLFAAGSGC